MKKSEVNLLLLTPQKLYTHIIGTDNCVSICVPKFRNSLLKKIFSDKFFMIKLDDYGSMTWLLIDGKRNVLEICNILTNHFQEAIQPVEIRTAKFFEHLYRNKIIQFNELNNKNHERH